MALAHLAYRGRSGGNVQFAADIGTNPFFQIKVGKSKRRYGGVEFVDEEGFVSPIVRHNRANDVIGTDFILPVPEAAFGDGHRFVQLWSYKQADRTGPAVSAVLAVHVPAARAPSAHGDGSVFLPSVELSLHPKLKAYSMRYSDATYREEGISESMFWSTLINALPQLVDQAVPIVRGLLGEGGAARRGGAGAGGAASGGAAARSGGAASGTSGGGSNGAATSGDLASAIAGLIREITQITGSGGRSESNAPGGAAAQNGSAGTTAPAATTPAPTATTPAPPPAAQAQSLRYRNGRARTSASPGYLPRPLARMAGHCVSRNTMDILRDNPRQMGMVLNDSILRMGGRSRVQYPYAEAKVAWAPIIAAVAPYVKDILEIGNKADADQRRHLEKLVELLDDPSLTALMATLSTARPPRAFKPDPRIHIDTESLPRVRLRQKERVVYKRGSTLKIPFKITTDHPNAPAPPIPRAIAQATIQDADTMAVLWEKEFRLTDVHLNKEVRAIEILPEETRNLPPNVDLKLEITMRWRGKDNRTVYGTMKNQFITLVDDVVFDQVGEKVGESVALNDVVAHRPYWHKVWEGGYADSRRWHVDFDVKYFYAVDADADEPSRLETRVLVVEDNAEAGEEMPGRRRVRAKLKAGIELTVGMLSDLLADNGHPEAAPEQLAALRQPEFEKYLNQVARVHLELKGKSGDTATVWVYPEIDFHNVQLLRVSQTNEDGQVLGMTKESVLFPRPSSVHFIGTQSE